MYFRSQEGPKKYTWLKTYRDGEVQPYDFGKFKKLISHDVKQFKILDKEIKYSLDDHKQDGRGTFLFIGEEFYITPSELESLLGFVKRGNKAIIISESLPDLLLSVLSSRYSKFSLERFDAPSVIIQSTNDSSELKHYNFSFRGFKNQNEVINWNCLRDSNQTNLDVNAYSYLTESTINGYFNQVLFKRGDGKIALNTTPVLFTNYALFSDTGFQYIDEMLSDLKSDYIYYDIYSRTYKPESSSMQKNSDSPLSYILKQKSFRAAWYLFIVMVILFLLFKAKRIQKIIPVIEQKRNTTVGVVETLSGLFYNRADHRQMAITKMQLFLFFIRHKLSVPTNELNSRTIKLISAKTNVSEGLLEEIFDYYKNRIETTDHLPAESLMKFYNLINQFYKTYNKK
ncbi:MAG: DUF4350 domain-containing protein [Bacteroidia bacterium]|nr:DUF4350 domain-containing protein [Bacteroidia bacterium]